MPVGAVLRKADARQGAPPFGRRPRCREAPADARSASWLNPYQSSVQARVRFMTIETTYTQAREQLQILLDLA